MSRSGSALRWRLQARFVLSLGPALAAALLLSAAAAWADNTPIEGATGAPVAGPNVNMVSGTGWPGGDPFLQRQNEPSVAVSTRNPAHLLAGANDYRTVDLPGLPVGETGDAWLGLFKSFDGGQTWQSTLLPGYPQDQSPTGLASPLKGFGAAADPVVRAGTDGLFYYSGITFNRGTNLGQIFVSRFMDLNNKENGDATQGLDPIKYLGAVVVDTGTSGQFLDKPWLAVDVPRAGAQTCTIPITPTQSVQAGIVYLAYAKFTSNSGNLSSSNSQVLVSRSLDCGATWSKPAKISAGNHLNQGTTVAIDPVSGDVYVAYRRFADSSQPDAIVVSKSTDFGQTFSSGVDAAVITPFDQVVTPTQFRTNALPAVAVSVDTAGVSRVHLAWSQRSAAGADARIVVSTSPNGTTWSSPVPVDNQPLIDDSGNTFTPGHQFMPSMTFGEGRLMVLYYDQRLDQTLGRYTPNAAGADPFAPDPVTGSFYKELRAFLGQVTAFGPFIDESTVTQIRHLLELRVAKALPADNLSFTSTRVSRFDFGGSGAPFPDVDKTTELEQLEVNPPNLPMFKQGTLPFIGDYIEIAGLTFVPTPGGGWKHNTDFTDAPNFHAVWTSNQDVVPPPDGDWTKYTPPPLPGQQASVFDPTQPAPVCVPGTGYEGTRNQNIYTSRISEGLLLYSPQNAKPLNVARAFVVIAQNTSAFLKAFRFAVSSPDGVTASFQNKDQTGTPIVTTSIDVAIPPNSSIARSVFAQPLPANPAGRITVAAAELSLVDACTLAFGSTPGTCVPKQPGGLTSSLLLNPPGALTGALAQPDNTQDQISSSEVYFPTVSSASVTSPNLASVTSASVTSASVTSASVTSASVTSTHIAVPQLASVTSASVTSASVTSNNISSASVTSAPLASVTSGNILASVTSAPISDANYTVTNTGNTTHSYHVKLVGAAPSGPSCGTKPCPVQLILSKPYGSPFAVGCQLIENYQPAIVANVDDVSGAIKTNFDNLQDPDIPDPGTTNATLTLAPGESGVITIRGPLALADMTKATASLAPVVVPHAGGGFAAPLLITSDGGTLPVPQVGVPYLNLNGTAVVLQLIGGTGPYVWSLAPGSALPGGLALGSTGALFGTPNQLGSFTTIVQASDSTGASATKSLTLTVVQGPSLTSLASSQNPSVFGQAVTFKATVSPTSRGSGAPPPTGTVNFTVDNSMSLGTGAVSAGAAISPPATSLTVGGHSIGASYSGDANYTGSLASLTQVVGKANSSVTLTSSANPSSLGQSVTFTAKVTAVAPGAGVPTGTVTFLDNGNPLASAVTLISGSATFSTSALVVGSHGITVQYSGDGNFVGSTSATLAQVVNKVSANTTMSSSLSPSLFGQSVTFTATVTSSVGSPSGTVTFLDNGNSLASAVTLSGGAATLSTSALVVGSHGITAQYSGDGNFVSTSATLTQVVNKANSSVTLTSSANPSLLAKPVTFTARVTAVAPGAGLPTGTVTFKDGTTTLGTGTLANVGGTATASFTTASLSAGSHVITAVYGGDTSFAASTSATLTQTVSYVFTGFQTPLTTASTLQSPTNSGSWSFSRVLPIKWQLTDGNGANITDLNSTASLIATFAGPTCPGALGAPTKILYNPTQGAAGGSTFRSGSTGFIFNWDATKNATTGCWWIRLQLADRSPEKVTTVQLN